MASPAFHKTCHGDARAVRIHPRASRERFLTPILPKTRSAPPVSSSSGPERPRLKPTRKSLARRRNFFGIRICDRATAQYHAMQHRPLYMLPASASRMNYVAGHDAGVAPSESTPAAFRYWSPCTPPSRAACAAAGSASPAAAAARRRAATSAPLGHAGLVLHARCTPGRTSRRQRRCSPATPARRTAQARCGGRGVFASGPRSAARGAARELGVKSAFRRWIYRCTRRVRARGERRGASFGRGERPEAEEAGLQLAQ